MLWLLILTIINFCVFRRNTTGTFSPFDEYEKSIAWGVFPFVIYHVLYDLIFIHLDIPFTDWIFISMIVLLRMFHNLKVAPSLPHFIGLNIVPFIAQGGASLISFSLIGFLTASCYILLIMISCSLIFVFISLIVWLFKGKKRNDDSSSNEDRAVVPGT